jgi:hypothetical protein
VAATHVPARAPRRDRARAFGRSSCDEGFQFETRRCAACPPTSSSRAAGPGEAVARGHACFAIGAWLWRSGEREASKRWFEEAVAAQPDNWAFRRQKMVVADDAAIGNFAATPEFFGAVQKTAAEGKRYYALIDMPGMPSE